MRRDGCGVSRRPRGKDRCRVRRGLDLAEELVQHERLDQLARARQPEVIIMDINLPGMSGVDALRVLRTKPETATIPVIALTAAASERDKERGTRAGFYRYLTKPVKVDELVGALEELLSAPSSRPPT